VSKHIFKKGDEVTLNKKKCEELNLRILLEEFESPVTVERVEYGDHDKNRVVVKDKRGVEKLLSCELVLPYTP